MKVDPALVLVSAAALVAALRWILAGWRDLSALTIGLMGASAVWMVSFGASSASLAVGAGAITLAWAGALTGASRGVGRPGLSATSAWLSASAIGAVAWPLPVDPTRLAQVAAVVCVAAGALLALVAMERPASRGRRPLWYRAVPVDGPATDVSGGQASGPNA